MIVLLVISFGICTVINGKHLASKTDKKIEKLFGKILYSDHIDEIAEKIAAKAVEKFNILQQKLVVTIDKNATFNKLPTVRGRKVAETHDELQPLDLPTKRPENEEPLHQLAYRNPAEAPHKPSYHHPEEEFTEFPTVPPTLPSIVERDSTPDPNYMLTQNLPLKNLGFKYRKQPGSLNREFDDNYGSMAGMDKLLTQEKPPNHDDHSFLQDSLEIKQRPVQNESLLWHSNEKVDQRIHKIEEFEETPQHEPESPTASTVLPDLIPTEIIFNETIHVQRKGDHEYFDEAAPEKRYTTTARTNPTRIGSNRLYAYQSSEEYADYHQKMARTPITEIMFRKHGGGEELTK